MKVKHFILTLVALAGINVLVQFCFFRWDLTSDKRYSLSEPTKELMAGLDSPVEVRLLLDGNMNASLLRLKNATEELLEELNVYGDVHFSAEAPAEDDPIVRYCQPIRIVDRVRNGQSVQTELYPYALIDYKGRKTLVELLKNNRNYSGEEKINQSIEQLEFAFAEAISSLCKSESERIVFLEGHDELSERYVYDLQEALSRYFEVDRGSLTGDVSAIEPYKVLVIADPQEAFTDADKFQLDQYLMHGGRILWVMDGVRFDFNALGEHGFTPVMPLDLNLQDMLFRYGVRFSPTILQDMQCLPLRVDVSEDPNNSNWQLIPWYYSPLLLTSPYSPISRNLMQVSSRFCSALELVGEDDGLEKEVLLVTSSASRAIGVPGEVDLSLQQLDPADFKYSYFPVAARVEGVFPSFFAHRMMPDSVICKDVRKESVPTKQIFVACGSVIRNEWQNGQPIPLGYDRNTDMQFANKDFLVNCVLALADDEGLIQLRNRELTLRLLNDKRAHNMRTSIQVLTIALPLLLLALLGICVIFTRKIKYRK